MHTLSHTHTHLSCRITATNRLRYPIRGTNLKRLHIQMSRSCSVSVNCQATLAAEPPILYTHRTLGGTTLLPHRLPSLVSELVSLPIPFSVHEHTSHTTTSLAACPKACAVACAPARCSIPSLYTLPVILI